MAREVAAEWGVDVGRPYPLSNHSYVSPVTEEAVLKVTSADDDESDQEADALALWNGDGAVRLIRRSGERRALLVERAKPGHDIAELPDERATAHCRAAGLDEGRMRAWTVIRGAYLRADAHEVEVLRALVR